MCFYPRSSMGSDHLGGRRAVAELTFLSTLPHRERLGRLIQPADCGEVSIYPRSRTGTEPAKAAKAAATKFPSCSLAQPIRSGLGWRGRHGARSTWTIRDRSDAIDRRHVTAQESARRSGASSIIPPPSGRIGAALSRLIVAGRRACMWSAMAAPGRSAPAGQSIGCRSQSGEPPRPCARAEATIS